MIIHDMRTPLVSILSSAELLYLKKGVREDCERYVAMIKKATNSLNDFINANKSERDYPSLSK